jgi:hypothetical protein
MPDAERPAQRDKLAEVVSVVIGDEQYGDIIMPKAIMLQARRGYTPVAYAGRWACRTGQRVARPDTGTD